MRNKFAVKEDPNNPLPPQVYGWRVYAVAFSAACASAMFGYDSAFIGGAMSLKSFQRDFKLDGPQKTTLSSNITSTFQAGAFFGAMFGYGIADWFGRRWNLILSGMVFMLGAFLQTWSHGSLGMMYSGRALTGIGVGASSLIVPIYIAECSPPTIRGRLIGIFEIMLQFAAVIGFWVNYGVNQNLPSNSSQWQIPFAIQAVPAGLLIITIPFMIESPRWLAQKGRHEQAIKSLAWVRNLPADHDHVTAEMAEIRGQLDHEERLRQGRTPLAAAWKELTAKRMRFRVLFAMGMKWMSNLTGVNALNYYSPRIFNGIGFTGTSTGLLATGVFGLVKTFATMIFILFLVDRWGRRAPLIAGSTVVIISMTYLGAYSKLSDSFSGSAPRDAGAYVAIIFVYIYAASFSMSWNAMPWIFAAEVFPPAVRTLAMLAAVLNQWLAQYIVVLVVPYLISGANYGTFFFFGASTAISLAIVYCLMPETKGFSLEDMHMIFENGSSWAPTMRKRADQLLHEKQLGERSERLQHDGLKEPTAEHRSVRQESV